MFGIAGTAELSTFCPGTGTWNRLQDGILCAGGLNWRVSVRHAVRDSSWRQP